MANWWWIKGENYECGGTAHLGRDATSAVEPTNVYESTVRHAAEFGPLITVECFVEDGKRWSDPQITWNSGGGVDLYKAVGFAAMLTAAVEYAKKLNAERAGKPAKEPA